MIFIFQVGNQGSTKIIVLLWGRVFVVQGSQAVKNIYHRCSVLFSSHRTFVDGKSKISKKWWRCQNLKYFVWGINNIHYLNQKIFSTGPFYLRIVLKPTHPETWFEDNVSVSLCILDIMIIIYLVLELFKCYLYICLFIKVLVRYSPIEQLSLAQLILGVVKFPWFKFEFECYIIASMVGPQIGLIRVRGSIWTLRCGALFW